MEIVISKYFIPLLLSVVAFFAPVHLMLGVVGGLLLIDTITGVWAAAKRGEAISSRRFSRVVGKAILYQIAVLSGHLLEVALSGMIPMSKLIMGAIALTEGKSLIENINTIRGEDIFKHVLDRITAQKEK